jgi:hypothetical protein
MQTPRGQAFVDHEPLLTSEEAREAFVQGQAAMSLRGLPCLGDGGRIEYLAVKFALQNGEQTTVLLDRLSAVAIRQLIADADALDWDANRLRPPSTAH